MHLVIKKQAMTKWATVMLCLVSLVGTGGCLTTMAVMGAADAVQNNADKYQQRKQAKIEQLAKQQAEALQKNPPPLKRIEPSNDGFFKTN